MTAYKVTYWNLSDGTNTAIIAANSPEEAVKTAQERDNCFCQLKSVYYIGDEKPMTTPATTTPEKMTPAEIRQHFDDLHALIDSMRHDIETLITAVNTMRDGIQHAATATPPAQVGAQFAEMEITTIIYNVDKNDKPVYMAMGIPYAKFGVRVWDEIIPQLGLDPANFKAGKNIINPPIRARVLLGETTNRETGIKGVGPHKVTGKA